jgi:hypothetical protein
MAQANSRRPLTAKASLRSQVTAHEIRGGESAFAAGTSVSPCQCHAMPPMLHTRLHFNTICIRRTEEWSLGAFKPSSAVRISGSAKQESIFKLLVPKQEFGVR